MSLNDFTIGTYQCSSTTFVHPPKRLCGECSGAAHVQQFAQGLEMEARGLRIVSGTLDAVRWMSGTAGSLRALNLLTGVVES
jgi:hypothetical protein